MDTKNSNNRVVETKNTNKFNKEVENLNKQIDQKDNQLLAKEEEIRLLKESLKESKNINKAKKGDIRAETNRQGDVKLICIGLDESGKRSWKKANELTDADIARMEAYRKSIKQNNAKKY